MMRQPYRPSSTRTTNSDDSSRQLTNAQRTFADVVGRELARLWIDGQTGTPPTNHQDASQGTSPGKL